MARRSFRLVDSGAGDPAYNMAVDEVLLAGAADRPTLRLYAWRPAAVSLGFFQPYAAVLGYPVVRRLTGGGAILHRDELTFAVAAPLERLGGAGRGVKASFEAVNGAIARGLAHVGVVVAVPHPGAPAAPGRDGGPAGNVGGGEAPFFCFERRSPTDLLAGGRKLVGSAERRRGGTVLHHGSIPLGAEDAPIDRVTVSAAAGRAVLYYELAGAIARGFREALDADLEPEALTPGELEEARRLAREKYGATSWTARR